MREPFKMFEVIDLVTELVWDRVDGSDPERGTAQ